MRSALSAGRSSPSPHSAHTVQELRRAHAEYLVVLGSLLASFVILSPCCAGRQPRARTGIYRARSRGRFALNPEWIPLPLGANRHACGVGRGPQSLRQVVPQTATTTGGRSPSPGFPPRHCGRRQLAAPTLLRVMQRHAAGLARGRVGTFSRGLEGCRSACVTAVLGRRLSGNRVMPRLV